MSTPKLRFKEFDGDWSLKKIGQISDCIVPGRNKPKVFNGSIPWITTPDLKDKVYVSDTLSKCYISENEAKNVGSKIVPTNSVIMSCVGDLGLFAINTKPIVINQQLHAFLLEEKKHNALFILNALSKNLSYIEKVATKTALPYLNKDNCNSIPIYLTYLEEQTKIASFLSAVDQKISLLTQKHELLSQYKQGMMQKLFSQQIRFKADDGSEFGEWKDKQVQEIADVKGGKRLPKGYSLVNENTGHPYITVSDMNRSYGIDIENIRYVPLDAFSAISRYTITDKDIFISVAGTLGIIGKIPAYLNGANLTENADKLTNLKCHQDFLIYLLDSGLLSGLIESTATTSAQPKLALYAIEQMKIIIPCLEEQTKIANFLSAIDQKIEVIAQQIEQSKTWKKGLLQQMFV
ncbi:restriction endonuclease subunit S [Acinetobacter gerneri]|uniref:restriction endonuclease subunit S n=1 Tax=Acinetobacter gerneri TaxID=202952 RepID=UPI002935DC10|nr:restriction endonuclease subunit S [Acinetobacter gerneri]MDV2439918.1 restriction endonuclease subunit S [Acinetobacter gerneri]